MVPVATVWLRHERGEAPRPPGNNAENSDQPSIRRTSPARGPLPESSGVNSTR